MSKEESIKQAYGDYYKQANPNENGWCQYDNISHKIFQELNMVGYSSFCCNTVRPKSLQGIETNNGWIKINSEADLPKEYCNCWVIVDDIIIINTPLLFNPITKQFHDNQIFQDYTWFSHYQIVNIPSKPIY